MRRRLRGAWTLAWVIPTCLAAACAGEPGPPKATPTRPTALCVRDHAPCRSAAEIEARLGERPLEVLRSRPTPGGAQGARVLSLLSPDGEVIEAKWRPLSATTPTNDPAGEVLAYRLQALVLPPEDHVVPPAAVRCLDITGDGCELGVLSYWLSDAIPLREARRKQVLPTPPGGIWARDPGLYLPTRFRVDPTYRRAVAHLNLVAHLVGHGDAHAAQFVLYRDPLHLFLVDNSVAFGVPRNPQMDDLQDLSHMWVPAIPADTAARLRELEEADVRALAWTDSWERRDGVLRRIRADSIWGDPDARIRREGQRVQIGLSASDVEAVLERVEALERDLRDGTLGVFPSSSGTDAPPG